MVNVKFGAVALALSLMSTPALATTTITAAIVNPASQWAGIDYFGISASQFSMVDQTLTFTLPEYSKIDLYMGGSSKFQFSDILINGASIANNLTVNGQNSLVGSGYAGAGTVALQFKAGYTCRDCWGDWFGGYVQVTKAQAPSAGPIPEPATWAMMIAGFALVGVAMRRRKRAISFV